jgi:hypothetical protein
MDSRQCATRSIDEAKALPFRLETGRISKDTALSLRRGWPIPQARDRRSLGVAAKKIIVDNVADVELVYVLYMPCHIDHLRALNYPWVCSPRADLDKERLMLTPAWERILTENAGPRTRNLGLATNSLMSAGYDKKIIYIKYKYYLQN